MLRELHIQNLAVIEDVSLELSDGLNCFTGQTGAGKSLVLGAFGLLLGLKSANAADMIRPGADEARVSGIFEIAAADIAADITSILDQPIHANDELLVTRKIFASGRSSASVNGQPVTASMVRAMGELLVDIHGQHDHQYLLKPSNQLLILDTFANCLDLRHEYAQTHARIRELATRRAQLQASTALRQGQLELYEFQAEEIDQAAPLEGEYDQLTARHDLLANIAQIKSDTAAAHGALYETEGSIVERLQAVAHVLIDTAELDPDLAEIAEQVRTATLSLQESAFDLSRYHDRLELSPDELERIDSRLNVLNRLVSKYGNHQPGPDPSSQILAHREKIQAELDRLQAENVDQNDIDQQIQTLRRELTTLGEKLQAKRTKAGGKLKPLVEAQLKDLGMADAQLHVEFEAAEGGSADSENPPDPLNLGSPSGPQRIELMIRTNPGQPARPLRRIASGGEMSRIMLALKSIFAQSDRVSVLVFDEIDANIGGRMGTVIGSKLRHIATGLGDAHQVLCITHLPQIAAYAHRHLRIAKAVKGKGKDRQTATSVTVIQGEQRIEELAQMLAGTAVTPTTRKQVKEMLDAACV